MKIVLVKKTLTNYFLKLLWKFPNVYTQRNPSKSDCVFFSSCIVKKVRNSKFALYFLYEYKLNFNLVIYIVFVKVKKENYENYLKIKQVNFCSSKYMKFKPLLYEYLSFYAFYLKFALDNFVCIILSQFICSDNEV